jgi:hypothetical protein
MRAYVLMFLSSDVILRPGPYIDAERDLGGLPYWLIRDPSIQGLDAFHLCTHPSIHGSLINQGKSTLLGSVIQIKEVVVE